MDSSEAYPSDRKVQPVTANVTANRSILRPYSCSSRVWLVVDGERPEGPVLLR
jgi:hypothetical protein